MEIHLSPPSHALPELNKTRVKRPSTISSPDVAGCRPWSTKDSNDAAIFIESLEPIWSLILEGLSLRACMACD
ncbi:hypothetical protein PanWU01x14_079910 [Parasponia andersonii]|uniref:Uncharacterized protein n=1 Tax=Parasponia andersonii TaxID=3476 RepID=A0A2P5DBE6_PARAD|nr:hypothetical protein PanWU01x14_079910 [Parasponia andersonii]